MDVHRRPLSRQGDLREHSCTVIRNPEKRKVGGSTPAPDHPYDQRKRWVAQFSLRPLLTDLLTVALAGQDV
jgi:hypothetical protein